MATVFRSRRATASRSGGKIVRARRAAGARTPYDRPRLGSQDGTENPSWLSRLLYSPTRMIATGAGKLLSTVFSPEASSSSASSSGDDSGSEDDIEIDDVDDFSTRRADGPAQKDGSSEMIERFGKEPQTPVGKGETKCLIEQLLIRETFSREECDQLTAIIRSRVVDCPTTENTEDGEPSEILNRIADSDIPDLCSTAIMEAKKWLQEKKLTNSNSDLDQGTFALNSATMPTFTEVEAGSPVDMARSYMQGRPPWASGSATHSESRYPSPIGIQLYKEETPYSVGGKSASSLKPKRESPSSGSWNIQEEIRRVRSKATEEMLRTSSKINRSAFSFDQKSRPNSLVTEKLGDSKEDKMPNSTQPIDASLNLGAGGTTSHDFPVSITQDGMQKESLSVNAAAISSEDNQDLEATRIIEGKGGSQEGTEGMVNQGETVQSSEDINNLSTCDAGAVDVDGLMDSTTENEQHKSTVGGTIQDSALHDKESLTSKEVAGTGSSVAANGFPSSESSLPAGRDAEQNPNGSNHDEIAASVLPEETCEFLSEASMEVPNVTEYDGLADGSRDSSTMQYEELSEDLTQPNSKQGAEGQTRAVVEKQRGRKMSGYNRRGRGRGRGK